MSTRAEKERQKAQQEKFQAVLSNLLKDEDNKYCVDCDAKGPRWASWNIGVFLCIRCAGIHRNLGVHISKVKSVNLDSWTAEQIAMMMEVGNSRARAAYEANLPDNYRRPQTDSALESFIRAKYEHKKYIAREWVPPKPSVPRELVEDDKDKRKSKPKASGSLQLASMPRSQSGPAINTQGGTSKGENKSTEKASTLQTKTTPVSSASAVDLIGLVFEASPVPDINGSTGVMDAPTSTSTSNNLLGDLNDFMGVTPQSVPSSQPNTQTVQQNQMSNGSIEANLFGETSATSNGVSEPKTSTKDSILALYGGQPTQQQFGVPGGMYMPPQQQQQQQQQQTMGVMYGMQQPQQMGMQQGMYSNQMGMMGMQGTMGMPAQQGMMGNMGQQGMQMAPNNMAMYNQQQQQPMQQMQFQQMQQQMAGMSLAGQPASGPMGGMNQGWGAGQTSGHTLSTNLWQ